MILVDTSVWINHLHAADERLVALLDAEEILGHPFVIGELALGSLRSRDAILSDLRDLPEAVVAEHEQVLDLVERHALYGRGIGYIDAHLLAAALLTPEGRLWTADLTLQTIAGAFGVAANPSH